MPSTLLPMDIDTSRSALEFVHRLLGRAPADQPPLEDLLGELAAAFGVGAAGLASLPHGQQVFRAPAGRGAEQTYPWQEDPSVLDGPGPVPGVVVLERANRPLLLAATLTCPAGVTWVLWLEDDSRDRFTAGEQAALALAGQVLTRRLGDSTPRWAAQVDRAARQQVLETAADVTRRLAHDFGNVLTGILGFTELALAQQVPANTPLHNYLNEVYRAAQTGAQFTHQLRLFSRRQSTSSRSTPLSAILAEQEARLFAARDQGVHLRLNVPADLPAAALDADHLHQVLTALLDNAREALVGPGSISLSARLVDLDEADCRELYGSARPGPHVEITVADTGTGLSPEVQRKLFSEPFFTTKARRRGFGLAVAYGILHAHRGGLRLHPGAEVGVVARVAVPVAPTAPPAEAAARPEVTCPSEKVRGERLLVVDDEPEVLQYLTTTLERAGYRVEAAGGGQPALDAYASAAADPFRLVLTDVLMPGINGVELVRRLLRRDPSVRVLFLSAYVSADFTQQDFASHDFELLPKPFRNDQLLRAVRAALDRPARRASAEPTLGTSRK